MRQVRLAVVFVSLLTLAACVPVPAHAPAPTDAATEQPLFATDAEALAAAEEVYREYLRVADEVDTPSDIERLAPLTSESWLASERDTRLNLEANGIHTEGASALRWMQLQRREAGLISAYACIGFGSTRVVDANGADVTPVDRGSEIQLLVTLIEVRETLVVDRSELWSNTCSS